MRKAVKKTAVVLRSLILCLVVCCSCSAPGGEEASCSFFAMDTYMTVTCYGERCEEAVKACEEEIYRLDALFSAGDEGSEISRLNREGGGKISPETAVVLDEAISVHEMTGGAFDITVYPVMDLWGFGTKEPGVPDDAALANALSSVGSDKLFFDREGANLKLPEGGGIDLGAIAKGYAGDRLMEIFKEHELTGAVASLGGNVVCYGKKPGGGKWKCGIRDPRGTPSDIIDTVELDEGCAITSGSYERYFEDEATGVRYHHIIDPATGYPAETGLLSVTVVSRNGVLADALSTACFVLGEEKSVQLWEKHKEEFSLIFVREDGRVVRHFV